MAECGEFAIPEYGARVPVAARRGGCTPILPMISARNLGSGRGSGAVPFIKTVKLRRFNSAVN